MNTDRHSTNRHLHAPRNDKTGTKRITPRVRAKEEKTNLNKRIEPATPWPPIDCTDSASARELTQKGPAPVGRSRCNRRSKRWRDKMGLICHTALCQVGRVCSTNCRRPDPQIGCVCLCAGQCCLSLSLCLSLCVSVSHFSFSVCLSLCLSLFLSLCLSLCLFLCLFRSPCLSFCLCISLSR